MPANFAIKQGLLLFISFQLAQDDGTPVDLTGVTLFSQVRDQYGGLVATPTLTVTDAAAGQFDFLAATDATWPLGLVKTDLFVSINAVPFFSSTMTIEVDRAVTQIPPALAAAA